MNSQTRNQAPGGQQMSTVPGGPSLTPTGQSQRSYYRDLNKTVAPYGTGYGSDPIYGGDGRKFSRINSIYPYTPGLYGGR